MRPSIDPVVHHPLCFVTVATSPGKPFSTRPDGAMSATRLLEHWKDMAARNPPKGGRRNLLAPIGANPQTEKKALI
jgi:hypothetical protein